MNRADRPPDGTRPLLSADELLLSLPPEQASLRPGTFSVPGQHLVCVGRARELLRAAVDPSCIRQGTLLFLGEPASVLLATGRAGYCPSILPAPGEFSVQRALVGSARLIGLGPADVQRALDRTQAEGLAKRRLKDLGPLEQRLVGLAHALSSDPELLLLEDPFEDLDDAGAELLLSVIEREGMSRSWIFGTNLRSPWSRRLAHAGELALTVEGGSLHGPVAPAELMSPGAWARFDRVSEELLAALTGRGAEIVRTPSQTVLLVRRLGGLAMAEVAAGLGGSLLELLPLMPGD